jgi:hypothetical protein
MPAQPALPAPNFPNVFRFLKQQLLVNTIRVGCTTMLGFYPLRISRDIRYSTLKVARQAPDRQTSSPR